MSKNQILIEECVITKGADELLQEIFMEIIRPPKGFITHVIFEVGIVDLTGHSWYVYATGRTLDEARKLFESEAKRLGKDINYPGKRIERQSWAFGA